MALRARADGGTGGRARRVVYLTFDDGPKKDTPELLDALEALDVPATFFLVGLGVRAFPEYARQIVQAGHAVGCHTMGHAAGAIKKDEDFVLRDIGRFNKMMSEEIEPGFSTDLFRFPGGSSSYKARIKAKVRDAGYAWFDWNMMTMMRIIFFQRQGDAGIHAGAGARQGRGDSADARGQDQNAADSAGAGRIFPRKRL